MPCRNQLVGEVGPIGDGRGSLDPPDRRFGHPSALPRPHDRSGAGVAGVDSPPLPPPFASLANDPRTYTAKRQRDYPRTPRFPMTPFRLSNRDIENLIAFVHGMCER